MVSTYIFVMENIFGSLIVSLGKDVSFYLFFCLHIYENGDVVEGHFLSFSRYLYFSFRFRPFESRSVDFYCVSSFQIYRKRDIQILMVSWSDKQEIIIFELNYVFRYDSSCIGGWIGIDFAIELWKNSSIALDDRDEF